MIDRSVEFFRAVLLVSGLVLLVIFGARAAEHASSMRLAGRTPRHFSPTAITASALAQVKSPTTASRSLESAQLEATATQATIPADQSATPTPRPTAESQPARHSTSAVASSSTAPTPTAPPAHQKQSPVISHHASPSLSMPALSAKHPIAP